MRTFANKLQESCDRHQSLLCVGLDPDLSLMAIPSILEFNCAIIDATKDLVCAYKPNLAFYESHGSKGISDLEETVKYIRSHAPNVIVVGDGKRGDIDSSNIHYARALFDTWDFDAATVTWYTGGESMGPFIERPDRGVFVLCHSSNPGAEDFQEMKITPDGNANRPKLVFELVAEGAKSINKHGNIGLVVGATYPHHIQKIRSICPTMPMLIPGVGRQGGILEASVEAGVDEIGRNIIINSSRSILYASRDAASFQDAAYGAASDLRNEINQILESKGAGW